uniref:Uncharacterized protein n=1 Tax=Setaria italica TaxID=4555 RepID=K3ZB38_SETIT
MEPALVMLGRRQQAEVARGESGRRRQPCGADAAGGGRVGRVAQATGSLVLWQRKKNRWKRLLLFTFWFSQSVENRGIIVRSLGLKREKKRKRWKLRKRKC